MGLVLIVVLLLFLIVLMATFYFFTIAFVRKDNNAVDDIDSPANNFLGEHRAVVKDGVKYINSKPFKWVYINSFDGKKLAARYFYNGFDKTIILFHGYRSSANRDFSCAVKMYTDFGLNILLVDQRSHGKSEGKLITFGVKERRDAASWAKYVSEQLNCKKILLGGMSMGATTVLLATELVDPNIVKGVVADCGFTSPAKILEKVGKQIFNINTRPFLPIINILCKVIGGFSIYEVSTTKALAKTEIPILLIHGESDGFVPCEMSKESYNSANCPKEIILVKNADHGMSFLVDKNTVCSKVDLFIKNQFK